MIPLNIFFSTIYLLLLSINLNAQVSINNSTYNLTTKEKEWIKKYPTITVQNEQDWKPFNYNKNNTPYGHSIDYIKLLGSKVGLNVKFIQGYSWKEYLEMLKSADLDMIVNIAKTPQREQFFSYTSPYHKVLSSLYMKEDSLNKYNSLKELEGKTISVVQGMVGESVLRNNYPKINIYPTKTSLDAIKAVIYNKADGVVQVNSLGNRLIKEYDIKNIKPIFEINDPKFNMHLHLATKKENTILRDILQKGIFQITDKELETLKQKHFINSKYETLEFTFEEQSWLQKNKNIKISIPNLQEPLLIKTDKNLEGMFPDFLDKVSEKLEIDIEIIPINSTKKLNVDTIAKIYQPNIDSLTSNLYTNQFLSFPMVIASSENSPIYNGLNDNNLKRLAIPHNSPLKDIIKLKYPHIKYQDVKSCKEGLNSLLSNNADGYICNPQVIAHTLSNMGISGVAISSITPYFVGFTLEVTNNNKILHSILNKTINSFSNQEIQNIKKNWQQLELQKTPNYTFYFQIIIASFIIIFGIMVWISWWNKRLRYEIKEKEIAQENALEQERRLSSLLDNIPGMAYRANNEPEWPMIEVNHASYSLTGYHREEFMSQSILYNDLIIKEDQQRVWKEVQAAINKNTDYYIEYQIKTKNGSIKWVWERGKPIYSEKGELLCLEGLIVDNSIVKDIELNLKEEQNKTLQQKTMLESIFNNSTTFMVILTKDGDIIFFNSFAEYLSGYTKEEVIGKNWFDIFIPNTELKITKSIFSDIMQNIDMHNDNINPIIKKDGSLRYIRWRNSIYTENNIEYLLGVGTDITEELRLETLYKDLHKSMQDAYGMIDLNGNLTDVNEMATKLLGYTKEEFLNLTLQDITPRNWHKIDQKHHQELLETKGCTEVFEKEFICKNGDIMPAEVRICAIKDMSGKVEGFWGFIKDITERKQAEQKIIESEQKLRTLIDTIPDMVWLKDTNGFYKFANLKYQEFLELPESKIINKTDYDLYDKNRADFYREHDKLAINAGKPRSNEEDAIHKDGSVSLLETVKAPVYNSVDEIIGVLGIGRDISELRKKEEMLIAQSRSAAMSDMISMIGHQWRQPLATLAMVANNMKADFELDMLKSENIEEYYVDINNQVKHLSKTIDDFRNFFKPNKTKEIVLVQNVIDDTLNIIGKSLENNNIEIIKDLKEVGEVSIFSNELFHVLLNIINNAKEALVDRDIKNKKIYISTYKDKKNIIIEIEDNAGGIEKDIIEKIFEPYFTTKSAKNGTGLGLYMAKTIIEKHFIGNLLVKNTKEGVKFIITIPK